MADGLLAQAENAEFRGEAVYFFAVRVVGGEALFEEEQLGDKIVLENARPPGKMPSLPDEPERDQFPDASPRKLPEPTQDRPLAEAGDVIRRILSADGTIHGDEDDPDFVPRQLAGIADAAEREGFLFLDLIPDAQGGVEHDVTSHNHGIGYEDSYAFVRDDSAVFDMRPANVFVTDEGYIVPVDCIPVKLPAGKREFFAK